MSEEERKAEPHGEEAPKAIIPDFYYELIARILPGGVLIALYAPQLLEKAGSVVLFGCLSALAWIIGLVLDTFVFAFFAALLWPWLRNKQPDKWDHPCAALIVPACWKRLPKKRPQLTAIERGHLVKAMAGRVFFRSMACISALLFCVSPTDYARRFLILPSGRLPDYLQFLSDNRHWAAALATFIFLCCWMCINRGLAPFPESHAPFNEDPK